MSHNFQKDQIKYSNSFCLRWNIVFTNRLFIYFCQFAMVFNQFQWSKRFLCKLTCTGMYSMILIHENIFSKVWYLQKIPFSFLYKCSCSRFFIENLQHICLVYFFMVWSFFGVLFFILVHLYTRYFCNNIVLR